MGLEDVAGELYGLPPEDFTATRNARAKAAKADGDADLAAAVQALRKPTAGAWLLNRLVRERRDEVEQVLELGVRLRAAQGTLGAKELRALDDQRRALTRAVAQQAVGIGRDAGKSVSASVASAVEETLRSAMVDPDAGEVLLTGTLVDTFSASGLAPVDLASVVAVGGVRPPRTRPAPRRPVDVVRREREEQALAEAREALERAERTLAAARDTAEAARQRATQARRRREEVRSEIEALRRRLSGLEEDLTAAAETEDDARRAQVTATREERDATEAAGRAQRHLDDLLADLSDDGG